MNRNTFSFECPNFNWANSIKQYQHTKLNPFEGRSCSPPQKISHKDIKHAEVFYNPITQKYNDKDFHRKTVSIEKNIIPNRIASYQDNALRYEQTYDIINLRDKLKVFKDHSDYPKVKDPSKNKSVIDMSKKEFNILSNINLKVHHFDKPENRPDKPSTSPVIKPLKKQLWTFKDYDIITNKYVEDHQKKEKVNDQAFKLEAANKYWATHDFNPVLGKFFDPLKESKFQDEEKKKAEIWGKDRVLRLPKKVQDEGLLYNPVNTKILDEERLKQYDLKIKNQKKRYERKNEIEDFILNKGISISERDEKRRMNRKCYEYYKVTDNRGYDIVNFNKNYNTYKSTLILKDNISDWDKLKNKSSMNKSTFNSKRIYKEEYDYFDANDHLHTFKQNREKLLSSLPAINKDVNFNSKEKLNKNSTSSTIEIAGYTPRNKIPLKSTSKSKNTLSKTLNDIPSIINKHKINLKKEEFFVPPKNIFTNKNENLVPQKKLLYAQNIDKVELENVS